MSGFKSLVEFAPLAAWCKPETMELLMSPCLACRGTVKVVLDCDLTYSVSCKRCLPPVVGAGEIVGEIDVVRRVFRPVKRAA